MEHFDEVVTQPGVTRAAIEDFIADPDRIGHSLLGRFSVFTSSGTTGTPGYFVHDPDAMAVYDALEAQRFRGLLSPTDLLRQVMEGDRYAMVAATEGHFAGIATVERMRRWAPWMSDAVRAFALLQPCAALVQELNLYRPTILATYPTAAEMLAEEQEAGRLRLRLREIVDRRRSAVGADAPARAAGVRLPRAQRVRRVGVPADRLGVPAPPPARQRRLGRAGTGGPAGAHGRAGSALALGAADQSGQPGPAADPLRPRRRDDRACRALRLRQRTSRRVGRGALRRCAAAAGPPRRRSDRRSARARDRAGGRRRSARVPGGAGRRWRA